MFKVKYKREVITKSKATANEVRSNEEQSNPHYEKMTMIQQRSQKWKRSDEMTNLSAKLAADLSKKWYQ